MWRDQQASRPAGIQIQRALTQRGYRAPVRRSTEGHGHVDILMMDDPVSPCVLELQPTGLYILLLHYHSSTYPVIYYYPCISHTRYILPDVHIYP